LRALRILRGHGGVAAHDHLAFDHLAGQQAFFVAHAEMRAAHAQAHRPCADLELLAGLLLFDLRFHAALHQPQADRGRIDRQHLERAARGQHHAATAGQAQGDEGFAAGHEGVARFDRHAGREHLFGRRAATAPGRPFHCGDHGRAFGHDAPVDEVQHLAGLQQAGLAHVVALLHLGPAQRRLQRLPRNAPQGFAGLHDVRRRLRGGLRLRRRRERHEPRAHRQRPAQPQWKSSSRPGGAVRHVGIVLAGASIAPTHEAGHQGSACCVASSR
jgi:hypothetical protein